MRPLDRVSIGVVLPSREAAIGRHAAASIVDFARRAEQCGFDSVWAGDSLTARPRLEPLTLLAAVAVVTDDVALGTAAMIPALRHPILAAHAIASVDQLSGGRLVLAVGAGYPGDATRQEFEAAGATYDDRRTRLLETVGIWRNIWSYTNSGGETLIPDDVLASLPRPVQAGGPRIWLAGGSGSALESAAKQFDGWLPYPVTADEYRVGLSAIHVTASRSGRSTSEFTPALYITLAIGESRAVAERELDEYSHAYYGIPGGTLAEMQATVVGDRAACRDGVAEYIEAGARHVVVRIGSLEPAAKLESVAVACLRDD
jgi:alkanesulfonate monooxygenase SsuD/methylene tetrahydromethanopterin reductase-like flavin-dependent oxidoreductase (luciferase family)